MTSRKYYTLVAFDKLNQKWFIEFGDYDRTCVVFELEDHKDKGYKSKDLKIITSGDTQAEINAAVEELNTSLSTQSKNGSRMLKTCSLTGTLTNTGTKTEPIASYLSRLVFGKEVK